MEVAESLTDTKISDSGYSNSCSNSQSQRSASLKSRNSGSNSSGSSGYGGKPSTLTSSNGVPTQQTKHIKDKSHKKKKIIASTQSETPKISTNPPAFTTQTIINKTASVDIHTSAEKTNSVAQLNIIREIPEVPSTKITPLTIDCENNYTTAPANDSKHQIPSTAILEDIARKSLTPILNSVSPISSNITGEEAFCCVISMHDGIVLFTSPTLTNSLGFPKDMWLGRTFMDFMHQKDRDTFTSHIKESLLSQHNAENKNTIYLLLRIYRGLRIPGFATTDSVNYRPFELSLSFREATRKEQMPPDTLSPADSGLLLVMTATPIQSAYALPNETKKDVRFSTRHTSSGALSHVDGSAVAACGFLPQDMIGRNVFEFYHPEDLPLLQEIYQEVVEKGRAVGTSFRSKPYRFLVQNGGYATVETEWSSFVNPWSRKLEVVTGLHRVLKGPPTPNVFAEAQSNPMNCISEEVLKESKLIQQEILQLLKEVIRRPAEHVKRQFYKRCQALASYMETLIDDAGQPTLKEKLPLKIEPTFSERDSVMLGEISPHHESYDSKSSSETPPSYNQLNYNENIQRFFESKPKTSFDEATTGNSHTDTDLEGKQDSQDGGSGSNGSGSGNISSGSNGGGANTHPHGSVTTSGGEASRTGSGSGNGSGLSRPPQLTKAILARHNEDMAKIMARKHREARGSRGHERKMAHRKGADKNQMYKGQGLKRSGSQSWEGDFHNKTSKQNHLPSVPTSGPMMMQHILKNSSGIPTSFSGLQPNIPHGFRVPELQHDMRRTMPSALLHPGLQNIPRPVIPSELHQMIHPIAPSHIQQCGPSNTRGVINNGSFLADGMYAQRNPTHSEPWHSFNVPLTPQSSQASRPTAGAAVIDNNAQMSSNIFQPLCYIPTHPSRQNMQQQNPSMSPFVQYLPGMVYTPHPIFGQPVLYPPFTMYHPMQIPNQGTAGQMQQHYNNIPPDKPTGAFKGGGICARNEGGRSPKVVRPPSQATSVKAEPGSNVGSIASASVVNRALSECSKRAFPSAYSPDSPIISVQEADMNSRSPSKERYMKEGEDGSYSSYYSSIFKTDNTSMEENDGNMCKLHENKSSMEDIRPHKPNNMQNDFGYSCHKSISSGMKNIDLNADVIHRYQMPVRKIEDILKRDRCILKNMKQPTEVNDQLAQLYLEFDFNGLSIEFDLDDTYSNVSNESIDGQRKIKRLDKDRENALNNLNKIFEESTVFATPWVP